MGRFTWVILTGLVMLGYGCANLRASAEYDTEIGSYWELSERASSIPMKTEYMNLFVAAIDSAHLTGHNALIYKTPQNSIEHNMRTLRSLQQRLNEIQSMDVQSFQYQQAIAQITAQEQGEAQNMIEDISGVWYMNRHPWQWPLVCATIWLLLIFAHAAGWVYAAEYRYRY